ncbi:hypothetical protein P3102_23635 [Amycolatopsis sp. QT-25]|uniref:hypothetical protein n=1 Tax=Amycolatopsis sp. QT-25 TaxID=3034022 RepID=UPI0023EAEB38|nr:hypothetical protein [Amycolatopsis sp. QT-25]WET77085.1 hypothetical protein P3102_23635 [Amycolatopsis sp. QT-25]
MDRRAELWRTRTAGRFLLVVLDDAASALIAAASGRPDSGVAALCGDAPLAIRITAARPQNRPQWTVDALAERLGSEHDRLAEPPKVVI